MKKVYLALIMFASSSFAHDVITKVDVENKIPDLHGVWETSVDIKGVKVFPQKGVFDMEGIAYSNQTHDAKKSGKYIVWDNQQKFKAPIINKLRVASGSAPVSEHDNEFVRLCRFDMNSDNFFEMSATQANKVSDFFPSFSPKHNCLLGGDTSEYWLLRYSMFYDKNGNKRGVR